MGHKLEAARRLRVSDPAPPAPKRRITRRIARPITRYTVRHTKRNTIRAISQNMVRKMFGNGTSHRSSHWTRR